MIDPWYSFVLILTSFPASQGIPWVGPTHTTDVGSGYPDWAPRPTDGPKVPTVLEDLKRDLVIPPNTCGWVDGNFNSPWGVVNAATCFWNSDLKVVNGYTTCVDYGQSACDGICPQANTCNILSPYCGSVYFPSGYRGYGNCNPTQGVTHDIELTYTGQIELVDLPIFTGANGISTGTQYPPGETPATISGPDSTATTIVVDSSGTSTGSIASSSSATSSHSSSPIGAIVGGAIGGLALICGTVVVIIWIVRSKGRDPTRTPAPGSTWQFPPDGNGKTGAYQHHTYELEQPKHVSEMGPTKPQPELENLKPPLYGLMHPSGAELDA